MRYSFLVASMLVAVPAFANPFTGKPDVVKRAATPAQTQTANGGIGSMPKQSAADSKRGFNELPPLPLALSATGDSKGLLPGQAPLPHGVAAERIKEPELPSYTVMGLANDQVILKPKSSDDTFLVPNHGKTPDGCQVDYPLVNCSAPKSKPAEAPAGASNPEAAPVKQTAATPKIGVRAARPAAKTVKATQKAKTAPTSRKAASLPPKKAAPKAQSLKQVAAGKTDVKNAVVTATIPRTAKAVLPAKIKKAPLPVAERLRKMELEKKDCPEASDSCTGSSSIVPALPTSMLASPSK